MKLSEFLSSIGRPVAFYPGLVKALGDRNEAIFICQMAYWRGKGESEDDWIYKTSDEIEEETSLTYKEQINVRKGLVKKVLLEENYKRIEHRMYFRVIWNNVNEKWEQFTNGHMPNGKQPSSHRSSGSLPEGSSLKGNTEIPHEITSDPIIMKRLLDMFVSKFGKFLYEKEIIRWLQMCHKAGEIKITEISEWAQKKEIHLLNRPSLLDSIETAIPTWKSRSKVKNGNGGFVSALDGQAAADLLRS